MVYVTRRAFFCAAHRYYDQSLSSEKNREQFGPCVNTHGHNYELEVTVVGEPDEKTGMVVNLTSLDAIVKKRVIDILDHKNLNVDIEEFKSVVPTTEMIARYAWMRLENCIEGATLYRVRLYEDPTLFVDYYGEGEHAG
ncbi:MAG: 6-carboxytetrahydropterin synthase [Candidatus Latescibacteria bacterium]|nr:6-carboxytetrahydropterin synthase [Candidatus Latescibacterota bacterium]NIM66375.1 6-carboxytetrahydropterin synthase [Candidatus Latescibacterota bacterium]NIO02854.1 6-carboxytetrahydropterin synthase [Candidatus Latescibacterota bacterium]NIO29989.1 6-carboxytetrahydropterin synthase [Candidatus Latescibacterota bacterium]NIO57604.1 6-carboxytetrahydropterin synthase [Candidatus Latescibacterota bacterium]